MPTYELTHVTKFDYTQPVSVSHHAGCLRPLESSTQKVSDFALIIFPRPTETLERMD